MQGFTADLNTAAVALLQLPSHWVVLPLRGYVLKQSRLSSKSLARLQVIDYCQGSAAETVSFIMGFTDYFIKQTRGL